MSDTPEADALEEADRYKVALISYENKPYDRMHELAQDLERERDQARREAENWKKWAMDAFCDHCPPPDRPLPWESSANR